MPAIAVALIAFALTVGVLPPAGSTVDPNLVGTWQLELAGGGILWVVRPDGTYRLHGPGAASRQLGRIEASQGRWSITSPTWADAGTYQNPDSKTWVVTGKVGTGTWKRVWAPGEDGATTIGGVGACRLVTPAEAAGALYSTTTGQTDIRAGDDGCVFRSQLSSLDEVSIGTRWNVGGFFQNHRKGRGAAAIDVPGVGDQAFAELSPGSDLTLQFLKGSTWVTLRLRLQPSMELEDLPYLAAVARAAAGRL